MWNESLVESSVILALRNTGIKRIRENSPGIGTRDPTTPPSRFLSFQVKLSYTCVIPHRSLFNLFLGLGTIEMLPSLHPSPNRRLRSVHNCLDSHVNLCELWLWEKHQILQELLTLHYLHKLFFLFFSFSSDFFFLIATWNQFKLLQWRVLSENRFFTDLHVELIIHSCELEFFMEGQLGASPCKSMGSRASSARCRGKRKVPWGWD